MTNTKNKEKKEIEILSPIDQIAQAVKHAEQAPQKVGLLSVKTANDWIEDSINMPDPKTFFHGLIVQYENTVIFAASNVGKSILAVQIAENIAWTEKVLYLDLELTGKQFQQRYTDPITKSRHIFPINFQRAEINPEYIVGTDLEQEILKSIEEAAKLGTTFFVVDNITFICNDSEKGATAGTFMMQLIRLKRTYNLTIVVIAHTPKRRSWEPITQNDLAGSAKLMNFFDAGIALARSAKDGNLRYLKQVKVRTGVNNHDADNVIVYDLSNDNAFLRFELQGYGKEEDHLKNRESGDDYDEIIGVLKLQREGKSIRQIAEVLGVSKNYVHRRLTTAKKNNITIPEEKKENVPPVPSVPHVGQAGQMGQDLNLKLQFNEEGNSDEV